MLWELVWPFDLFLAHDRWRASKQPPASVGWSSSSSSTHLPHADSGRVRPVGHNWTFSSWCSRHMCILPRLARGLGTKTLHHCAIIARWLPLAAAAAAEIVGLRSGTPVVAPTSLHASSVLTSSHNWACYRSPRTSSRLGTSLARSRDTFRPLAPRVQPSSQASRSCRRAPAAWRRVLHSMEIHALSAAYRAGRKLPSPCVLAWHVGNLA